MLESMATVCLLTAAWLWWKGLRAIVRGLLSRSWPTAGGVIRAVRVVKKNNSKGIEVLRHVVEYSYSVDGKDYRGTRIRFGIPESLNWSDPRHPAFRPFRRGAAVDVYHSPSRPSIGALQHGFSPFVFVALVAGAVIAWMGIRLLTLPG